MFNRNPMLGAGMFGAAAKTGINWGGILSNTQKTLGIINQAIPVFYQVKPIWNNAKTMFKLMGEMGKLNSSDDDNKTTTTNNNRSNNSNNVTNATTVDNTKDSETNQSNGPNFFI